jgi:hypothetical protein
VTSTVTLGGREFRVVDMGRRTVLLDHYLMRLIRATGIDRVMPMDGDGADTYLARLQSALIDSGRAHELIAGYLLPVGMTEREWTPDIAREVARHVALCDTEADREQVMTLALEVSIGFFRRALRSLNSFPSFLPGERSAIERPSTAAH